MLPSMGALKPIVPKQFDDAKLQAMAEPLIVRVERLRGTSRSPIPLPISEEAPDQPGGTGYDREAIRGLEEFLVTRWSGGGAYEITVTDANGQTMKWTPSWPVDQYPEIVPPPLRTAHNPTPSTPRRTSMPAFPNGFPNVAPIFGGMQQQPQMQMPQYGYPYGYPPLPPPPPVGTPQYQLWSSEARDRQENAELTRLREENARREREAIQARHQAELDRERQANEARFAKQEQSMTDLRAMITTLTQNIAHSQNTTKPNAELEALKMQLEANRQAAERERYDRETERRERETRDMMKQMAEQSQRQIDAMSRQIEQFQAALAATTANRQDPMVDMLKEQARQAADSVKELSRNFATQLERMQVNMLSPRDILALAKESTAAADQATDKLSSTYSRIFDLHTKATETALQLQPQGSPVADLVREGFGNLRDMGERYFGRAELQAKLEAEKQAQLVEAQRDLQIAAMYAQGVPQQQQMQSGLAGPSMPPPPAVAAPGTKKRKKAGVGNDEAPKRVVKRLGKTDEEWFGPLQDNVMALREGVATFLEAVKTEQANSDGSIPGIDPEQAAAGLAQAVGMVMQQQLALPIMQDLLFQHRFPDFMDVLLPDAPEQYKADVINILIPLLRGEVGGGERMTGEPPPEPEDEQEASEADEDDGDDATDAEPDEGDDDGDDRANDGAPAPPRISVVKPVANGRSINPPRRA